jgi:subtilisin family serine protease
MKHSSIFQRKPKYITLLVIIGFVLSCFGFSDGNNSITNFYYYKDKPYTIDLRTDKIFIKAKQLLSTEELKSSLSIYPQVSILNKYDKNEKMQFVDLNKSMNSSELIDLLSSVSQNSNIEYTSPVFSPREGEGNTKVLQGVTDAILVQFKQSLPDNVINNYINDNNFTIVQVLDLGGGKSYVLSISNNSGMNTLDVSNMVYNSGLVNWAEPNFYYSGLLSYVPNDQFFPRQWSIRNTGNNIPEGISGTAGCDMRVDSAWNITLGIPQCVVGMVDSGIDTTHEDIKANLINAKGYDFINGHPLQTDDMNHGTCTGGIVAAVDNNSIGISGIAPNVKLIGIKIFNAAGTTTTTALTNGLIYSWQQGEWISSNSWGGGSPVSAADQGILDGVTLGRSGKGTVFCVATGNSNGALQWPATNPNVISVGGNSPCNQRKSTTSCDNETWWGANYGTGLYIVAPCVKVYATDRMGSVGYTTTNYDSTFNGTSSATPNAAGVCALALSLDSTMRWDTLRVRMSRTADKVGSYTYTSAGPLAVLGNTWNTEMGYGKVNAYRLLKSSQTTLNFALTALLSGNFNGTSMVAKIVRVELHNSTTPYALVDSQTVLLNSSGIGNPVFTKALNGTPYYIVLKFNNGLETWSATTQTFSGSTLSYDFTTAATKAYGSNMVLVGTKWCIISGDANQDGSVDALDRSACWNDRNLSGVYVTDLNGDGVVDALDRSIAWNNRNLSVQKPALAANPTRILKQDKKKR